ncbi:oxygen-dependent choline dehydrogenase-like [Bradysia coprophila]|uniref:oxygen-dependent choline dehydrogenase-like n=1 Tax=Bradysia coprophila TaxID=38358 RepID=UPI00187DA3D8|nr:oxygen-dependent choline dehydrogenase-like [Bradysia coprophila]
MNLAAFLFSTVTVLMHAYMESDRQSDLSKTLSEIKDDINFPRPERFDFIIVGGGAAGCTLAGMLAEHFTVLLLEKGGSAPPTARNLFLQRFVARDPVVNDFFYSSPQSNMSLGNGWGGQPGVHRMVIGKMLGGSQSHNAFKYSRGSQHDYNYYATVTGDDSWSWENMKKYFLSIENFDSSQKFVNESNRAHMGTSGPVLLDSSYETNAAGLVEAWFEAGRNLGYEPGDPNGERQHIGFTALHRTIRNGERQTAYNAFVEPLERANNPNLVIRRYSFVEEILFNSSTSLVAEGVRYKRHGFAQIALARREVIVSSGAHASPLLLMRSGIGPADVLNEANIPVRANLAVGKNLKAHVCVEPFFTVWNPPTGVFLRIQQSEYLDELDTYLQTERTGAFSQANTTAGNAFLVTSIARERNESDWSDLQIVITPRIPLEDETPIWVGLPIILNRIDSVGELRFNTAAYQQPTWDDSDLAIVDYKMYSAPIDMEKHLEGLKLGFTLLEETEPFKSMNFTWRNPQFPACDEFPYRSDDYWRCYIQHDTISYYHDVGTCKMGNDDEAIVDSKFRVRGGIQKLRVVDASIFPQPINSNIQASVMVIAAKASDEIIQQYNGQGSGANMNLLKGRNFFIILVVISILRWLTV